MTGLWNHYTRERAVPGQRVSTVGRFGIIRGTITTTWIGRFEEGEYYYKHQCCYVRFDDGSVGRWRVDDLTLHERLGEWLTPGDLVIILEQINYEEMEETDPDYEPPIPPNTTAVFLSNEGDHIFVQLQDRDLVAPVNWGDFRIFGRYEQKMKEAAEQAKSA